MFSFRKNRWRRREGRGVSAHARHLEMMALEERKVPAVIAFQVVNDWGGGFQGEIRIQNNEAAAINNWRLEFDFPGQITQLWNGTVSQPATGRYLVANAGWNGSIAPGQTVAFGFLATPGRPTSPTNYLINGRSPGGGAPAPTPSLSVDDVSIAEGNPSTGTAGFLSTAGNQIVDASGRSVRIAGVNWFGMETTNFAPHGLWTRGYKPMMDQMKDLGFNTIRLPFSNQLFDAGSTPNGIDFSKNPDLAGLNGLQILDKIVDYAGQIGLRIMLDNHRSAAGNGPNENGLWYTSAYPESRWISDWTMLATRYRGNPTVIGADLKNEPHAGTWGTGSATTDWRLAAERAGNAVLAANPDWLIVVEGVASGPSGNYWWGGNLSAAGAAPVRLNVANRLVYSPHDYPQTVYNQPWFSDPSYPNNLPAIWDANWGYLYRQNIAPVLLGEFGTKLETTSDRLWLEKMVDYLEGDLDGNGSVDIPAGQQGPSWTYWSWNPNSSDTGGILADDWQSVRQAKVDAVAPVQFGPLGSGGAAQTFLRFTARLSAASSSAVTVNYTTAAGTATAGTDYTTSTGSLTFAPGETTKTVAIAVTPDLVPEPNETLYLRLSAPVGATLGDGEGVGTIVNDDTEPVPPPPPPPLPSLTIEDRSANEGQSGSAAMAFTVRLSAPSAQAVTVSYSTANGTATAGSDYTAATGTLTFAPGETSKTIGVSVLGDSVVEANETFSVQLGSAAGATISRATAVGTIVNDDIAPPPPPPPSSRPAIGFKTQSVWGSGFTAEVTVRNVTAAAMTDWVLEFDSPFAIVDLWNATLVSKVGTRYTLRAKSYNGAIAPGSSVAFGFRADGAVGSGMTNVKLNGVSVTVG